MRGRFFQMMKMVSVLLNSEDLFAELGGWEAEQTPDTPESKYFRRLHYQI